MKISKITNILASAKKVVENKRQTNNSKIELVPDFEVLEKKSIQNLKKHRLPTWSQLKHLTHFLSATEKKIIKITGYVLIVCIILLGVSFYWSHSVLIATEGGEYTEGLVGSPNYINPLLAQYNDVDRDLSKLLFNGLLRYDQQGSLVLDLAEELHISADQKEYTFTIKTGVTWHDGEPLTVDDIIFTIASIQDPNWQSPNRLAFANVNIEKIDDNRLKIILTEPLANFLHSLTVGIIPEHLWISVPTSNVTLAELNKKPIGTGPFKFASLTKDKNGNIRTIALNRNENYFEKTPYLETISFKFYGDYETGVQALRSNNIEGLNLLPKEYSDQLTKNKDLVFHRLSLPQYTAIFFNTQKNDLLKDKALRQGLTYAIDRQLIIDESLNRDGEIIDSPILPGYFGYTDDVTKYEQNIQLANELLDKTGWVKTEDSSYRRKNGDDLVFTLTTVENPEYEKALEIIKSSWEAVGVKTNLAIIPRDKIKSDIIEPRNYEALLFGQIIKSDPYPFWHSSQIASPGVNLSVWAHQGIDDLLEQSRTQTNIEERASKLVDFQKILTEHVPAIFLYNPIHLYPITSDLQGVDTQNIISPADRFNNITNWYIKTKRHFSWREASQ